MRSLPAPIRPALTGNVPAFACVATSSAPAAMANPTVLIGDILLFIPRRSLTCRILLGSGSDGRVGIESKERPPSGGPSLLDTWSRHASGYRASLVLFNADRLDLLFSFGLRLERRRSDLNPGCLSRARLDDLTLLRRLLLDDVIVGACR